MLQVGQAQILSVWGLSWFLPGTLVPSDSPETSIQIHLMLAGDSLGTKADTYYSLKHLGAIYNLQSNSGWMF